MSEKVNIKAISVATGLLWGGYLGLSALLEMIGLRFLMWNTQSFGIIQSFYPGIEASITGIIIALVWGFLCAAIAILIVSGLYNNLTGKI